MEIKAKVRKFVDENKYWILGGCIAGYIAIRVWEDTHLKTVYITVHYDIFRNSQVSVVKRVERAEVQS